jgi:hypothetical protein
LTAPSASRNAGPIREVLARYVPDGGVALEIASGTGQHIAALAQGWPGVTWQPSDISRARFASVEAWRAHSGVENLRAPVVLDAGGDWSGITGVLGDIRLVYLVNLFHLVPGDVARGIIGGAARALPPGGHFFIYGPFRRDGKFRSDGDVEFDRSLRAQDARIGYKDMEWMEKTLGGAGFSMCGVHDMPADNLVLVARKGGTG